jgi:hypothetical protein
MEITSTPFQREMPKGEQKIFYLYMTKDPRARPQIYFSLSGTEQNKACDILGSYNIPMDCLQIKGTESEVIMYREQLEKERTIEFEKYQKELKDGKTPC